MRRAILALVLLFVAAIACAQPPPISWTGGGSGGSADPSQFSSPDGSIAIGGSIGSVTMQCDGTVCVFYSTGTSDPATCTAGGMFHLRTDSSLLKSCVATDTWLQLYTITDDSVLVGTGTTTASKAIADCDDTGGNHLNYDTATNAFSCGTSGSSSAGTSLTQIDEWEDFTAGLATTGNVGTKGLGWAAIGAGTLTLQRVSTLTSTLGVARITTVNATDNSGGIVSWGVNSNSSIDGDQWDANNWAVEGVIIPNNVTNAGMFFGLSNSVSADPFTVSGNIGVRWDTDRSDTTYMFVVCDSATAGCGSAGDDTNQKTVASTRSPSAGVPNRFTIRKVASGVGGNPTIYMSVGVSGAMETEKTFCASGCDDTLDTYTGTQDFAFIVYYSERATGANLTLDVDYMRLGPITGLTRY